MQSKSRTYNKFGRILYKRVNDVAKKNPGMKENPSYWLKLLGKQKKKNLVNHDPLSHALHMKLVNTYHTLLGVGNNLDNIFIVCEVVLLIMSGENNANVTIFWFWKNLIIVFPVCTMNNLIFAHASCCQISSLRTF